MDISKPKSLLRLQRNLIYAIHGYAFQNTDLREYFNNQWWYIPNPNLKLEDIKLNEREQVELARIKSLEEQFY